MESCPVAGLVVRQIAELTITGLSHDGAGVGRLDGGEVVFVPQLLPGERARIQIVARARKHLIGAVLERLHSSEDRRQPPCILADHCGGCALQHQRYDAQLQSKQLQLEQALSRIAQLDLAIEPIVASPDDLGYRNRAVIPLERSSTGVFRAGYYRRGSHRIVNMNRCPVLDPRLDALIEPLKRELDATDWPVDRHLEAQGGLRHLSLRIGAHSGEILITLIASNGAIADLEQRAEAWLQRWPNVVGVMLNLQPEPGNRLFGPNSRLIAGRPWLLERFCGLDFELECDTFFQVNTQQAERVVPLLLEALGPSPRRVIDAYCGVGSFTLPLAAAGHRLIGLELHPASIARAEQNALRNGLAASVRFVQGTVATLIKEQLAQNPDAVLVDPPRKGLEAAVTQALCQQPVGQLLYLSCDPATLARDLGLLCSNAGYRVERVQPLDFFPNTSHVETLVVLSS